MKTSLKGDLGNGCEKGVSLTFQKVLLRSSGRKKKHTKCLKKLKKRVHMQSLQASLGSGRTMCYHNAWGLSNQVVFVECPATRGGNMDSLSTLICTGSEKGLHQLI